METISDTDLKALLDDLDGRLNENEKWERVIEKSNDNLSYSAKCCKPKVLTLSVFIHVWTEILV